VNQLTNNQGGTITKDLRTKDDPQVRQPDISKAKRVLGWEPKVTLQAGLELTIPWFREELQRLGEIS
jgi:dTDP-glucose 4,6-dehydratase